MGFAASARTSAYDSWAGTNGGPSPYPLGSLTAKAAMKAAVSSTRSP